MTTNILNLKEKILPIAKKYKLNSMYLFGSRARGDANTSSDYDFYVERNETMGMFELSGLFQDLQELLQREVDIVVKPTSKYSKLDNYISQAIQQDGILLYAE